jgi:hypothetical protein
MNVLARAQGYGSGATGVACSATVDSSYPLSSIYDGRSAFPMKLSAATTGFFVSWPNSLVANGDMEQGTTGWTTNSVTATSETGAGNYHKGSKSLKLVATVTGGYAYQRVTVQAGEYLQIWAAAKSDGTNYALVRVKCLDTGQYVKDDGTWYASSTAVMNKTGNTMTAFTPVTFRVPTFAEIGRATATLEILLQVGTNGATCYFDEVLLVPGIDWVSLHGHGLDASTGLAFETHGASYWHSPAAHSISFGSATNAALKAQTCAIQNTSRVYDPFPGVYFYPGGAYGTYTTMAAPWLGELVVGQSADLTCAPDYPVSIEYQDAQERATTAQGGQYVYSHAARPRRVLGLSWRFRNDAEFQQVRDTFFQGSSAGRYPMVVLPTETDPDVVVYGRCAEGLLTSRVSYAIRTGEMEIVEEPLPVM